MGDSDIDRAAPSLREIIMEKVWEREALACRHIRVEIAIPASESRIKLPQEEIEALINAWQADN